jgi:hypothetical protein
MDLVIAVAHNLLPERPERLGLHAPLRDWAELAVYRAWQELFCKEIVQPERLQAALDRGGAPELFLRAVAAYVHRFGHRWWSRALVR